MQCGYLRIIAEYPEVAAHLAARVTRWAGRDAGRIDTNTNGRNISIVIPEEIMLGKGALQLMDGGPDVLATAFKAGRTKVMSVGSGDVTKPTTAGGPAITRIVSLGNTVAVSGSGTVDIYWGDGATTAAVTNATHTYTAVGAAYLLRLVDRSTKLTAEAWVVPVWTCYTPDPTPPPPANPTVTNVSPACHWGWDPFPMTITGTRLTLATTLELVQLGEVGTLGSKTETSAKVNWGEIEYNGPGDAVSDVKVNFTGYPSVVLAGAFRMRPPGNVC